MFNKSDSLLKIADELDYQAAELGKVQQRIDNARKTFGTDQLAQLDLDRLQTNLDERRYHLRRMKERVAAADSPM